jgi:predicted AAA+ superfamily ATPase
MKYITRWIEKRIEDTLESHPVVILSGPRQVGKSTLLTASKTFAGWRAITLDDVDVLDQAKHDPKGLLWDERPMIIDEVQRCPELLITVKHLVDASHRKRKFILSGSGNVSLRKEPRETLAGRAKYLHASGFAYRELAGLSPEGVLHHAWTGKTVVAAKAPILQDIPHAVWRGSLPGVVLSRTQAIATDRLSGYIDTYLQRDIQDLVKIRHPENFRTMMSALARATGRACAQEELAGLCGESRPNVSRYLALLEETQVLYALRGYTVKNERAYKHAKYFWFDSGAACFLSGMHDSTGLEQPHVRGRYFENYVLHQIRAWGSLQTVAPTIGYWQSKTHDAEVDFVLSAPGKTLGIEVKSSKTLQFSDTKTLRLFMAAHPEVTQCLLVYAGNEIYPIATNIIAVPITAL